MRSSRSPSWLARGKAQCRSGRSPSGAASRCSSSSSSSRPCAVPESWSATAAPRAATPSPSPPTRSTCSRSSRLSMASSARRARKPAASGRRGWRPSGPPSATPRSPTSPAARPRRPARACTTSDVSRLASAAVIAALAVVGCGGGGDDTKTQARAKIAYIARADAICEKQQAKREGFEDRVAGLVPITAGETHEVAVLLRRAAGALETEVRNLRALHPPSGDAGTPESVLSILEDQTHDLRGFATAYDSRDSGAIRAFQSRIADYSAKASALAEHYGFQVCGSPGNGNTGNLTRIR